MPKNQELSEQTQFLYRTSWGFLWVLHTKDSVWSDKTPFANLGEYLVGLRKNLTFGVKNDYDVVLLREFSLTLKPHLPLEKH